MDLPFATSINDTTRVASSVGRASAKQTAAESDLSLKGQVRRTGRRSVSQEADCRRSPQEGPWFNPKATHSASLLLVSNLNNVGF